MLSEKTSGGRSTGAMSLKGTVKAMIMASRLSDLTKEECEPEENLIVPDAILNRWGIVADRDDVRNGEIYKALETAKEYISTTEGKDFIDNNLHAIICHLLSQSPHNFSVERDRLGQSEFDVVEKCIRFALILIVKDLDTRANSTNKLMTVTKCRTLQALESILNSKFAYYEESPVTVRMDKIFVFQRIKGFYHLGEYLNARAGTLAFPEWEVIHRAFRSAHEGMNASKHSLALQVKFRKEIDSMYKGVMKHLTKMEIETLEEEDLFKLEIILLDVKTALNEVTTIDPSAFVKYCHFQKAIIIKLLSTQCEQHKQLGQGMLYTLIETVYGIKPQVKSYRVYDAGLDFVNGRYVLAQSRCDKEGYIIPGIDVCYKKIDRVTGEKMIITLDKSSNDGQDNATWFLSEEHKVDEPGVAIEYSDYYTASGSFKYPPLDSWETTEGSEPPTPTLKPQTELVPVRETHASIRYDLARWLIETKVLNLVFSLDLCFKNDSSTTAEIISALDVYREGSDALSDNMANLFVAIVPQLQSSALPTSSSAVAEIEAAQARLASAEQWEALALENLEDAQDAVSIAETKHQSAIKAVDVARKCMESLNSSIQSDIFQESKNSFESAVLHYTGSTASDDTFKSASTSSLIMFQRVPFPK